MKPPEIIAAEVLLSIAVIITLSAVVGPLFRRIRQPAVVGQIVVGLAIGLLPKRVTDLVFRADALPFLKVIAQVGLVLFLFTVGYELNLAMLRRHARDALLVGAGALVVPMLLGGGLGWVLTARGLMGTDNVEHGPFVLYFAVVMSITAVPVLAWILRERGIGGTVVGVVTLASAGLMDVVGWLLLAVSIVLASAGNHSLTALSYLLPVYLVVMLAVVRPLLRRLLRSPTRTAVRVPVVMALTMVSAWCTSKMGLHLISGALLVGLLTARGADGEPDHHVLRSVEQASAALLPVFFVITGLTVSIGGLRGWDWFALAVVCALAAAGKVGGGALAARVSGMSTRDSVTTGVLLNTRGLTELVALEVGFQTGLIGRDLYTVLVLMAVFTTALTGPLLSALRFPDHRDAVATDTYSEGQALPGQRRPPPDGLLPAEDEPVPNTGRG